MLNKLIYLILMTASISAAQSGQAIPLFTDGVIKGIVVDSVEGSPLPFANVTLHSTGDSSYLTGTATGTNGEFILSKVTEGDYILKVSYIGYTNKILSGIKIIKDRAEYNAGSVKLYKSVYELSEANVTGDKVSEELHLDKKVINVSQNLNAAGGTALDVLQNQPSVRVDADGTVSLRGSSNFTVLINGKPGVLQGADALRQISANTIENIELITNPSAKYDAQGTAGIININLKKSTDYTLSGIFNANSGTRDKYNGDFTMNYNVNGLNLTAGLDYRENSYFNEQEVDRYSFSADRTVTNSTDLSIRDKRRMYSGRAGVDYTFDPQNSVSISLSSGKVGMLRSISTKVQSSTSDNNVYANTVNSMDVPLVYFNSTLNYIHKFVPDVNDLSFELTYANINLPSDQSTNEYITDSEFNNRNADPKVTLFNNDAIRNEGRGKLVYSHKFSPSSTFETGMQTNIAYRDFDIVNETFDYNSGLFVIDNILTNKFSMWNNVYAGFATYSNELYSFKFQLGLRGEYMYRLLEQQTLNSNYKYEKMDFFPSFSISRKIEEHQVQFSYSRRVNRPNENLLNPYPFYSDSYLTTTGNPKLLPEYINSYELNYQKMFGTVFLGIQTYFRNSNNLVLQEFTVDNNGKMYTTFGNFAKSNTYGSEISGSLSAGIFKFDPSVNIFGSDLSGDVAGLSVDKEFFNWSARLNATVTLTPDTRIQLSGNYFPKIIDAQSEIEPLLMMNATVRQDFMDKKFSVTLQARNFLKTSYMKLRNSGINFNSQIQARNEVPVISLMFTYNFNNFKKNIRQTDNIDIPTGI
jgi:outer membrane receptor protein involved in Fe transport